MKEKAATIGERIRSASLIHNFMVNFFLLRFDLPGGRRARCDQDYLHIPVSSIQGPEDVGLRYGLINGLITGSVMFVGR